MKHILIIVSLCLLITDALFSFPVSFFNDSQDDGMVTIRKGFCEIDNFDSPPVIAPFRVDAGQTVITDIDEADDYCIEIEEIDSHSRGYFHEHLNGTVSWEAIDSDSDDEGDD